MKRFRFETIHLVMIGMIVFGLLAISVRLTQSETSLLIAIFLACLFLTALLYFQKESYQLSEDEQIELLNDKTEVSLKTLLDKMPVGVIKFNPEASEIDWYNPYAQLIFSDQETGQFDTQVVLDLLEAHKQGALARSITIGEARYNSYMDLEAGVFYFFDASQETEGSQKTIKKRPVIGIMSVDNYDDFTDNMADADISSINSFVANFIANFAEEHAIFYRRVAMDRFYFFTDYGTLEKLINDKFDILDRFRQEAQEYELSLTLSMGIAYGRGNHNQIGVIAQENLNIALVRGGDQVVLKENEEHADLMYFGGGTVSTVKRSRTRTRAMMSAISDKIKSVDKVFVVGHRRLDMDALGSSVGMQFFASQLVSESYVVYDPNDMGMDIERAVDRLKQDESTNLVTVSEALQMVDHRSLLIMVDHSKTSLTLSKELFDEFRETIVVDHHRRDDDFPDNAVLTFIESGASSAAELVTELITFQNAKSSKLNKLQASLLMAGIMLDTKNFSTRVTSRTFDVASYLRTLGSDSVEIQSIAATDFEEYRQVNELILRAKPYKKHIMIASGPEDVPYNNVIASKAADSLLMMADIEASFVISKNSKGQTTISARSRNNVNVQRIMEQLGGGGHFNLAACQCDNIAVIDLEAQLLDIIDKEVEEE
ncbi:DHH family phosphoesterase [Streptococcus thoraltensis]|uniref:DHH family phosphoesterase n=1 Tax=Streptococcus thoraltensis TaxID=55085 RepID=UPI001F58B6E9|nr:DHH family phosphoesterase [Streptococcus thoraltensis]